MKILLTGAAGQLGRSIQALAGGHEVVALARRELDISDLDAVRNACTAHRPDLVLNAAAYNKVDDAEADATDAYVGNALGPRNLALSSAEIGAAVVHVSTDYVFDGRGERAYHEYDATGPRSEYGRSKLAGEIAVRERNPRHYVVRTAWVYHEEGQNFPRTMMGFGDREEVRVVHDQVGSPTYAPHLAQGILDLIGTDAFGTYHMAGSGRASWHDLTVALYGELGLTARVVPVTTEEFPRPAERPRFSVLETVQSPKIVLPPWREGLAEFCRRVGHRAA